ncbi:hypothetical protein AMECASPLE_009151 [Ameca splendens]|uniref:Uncharacterized protein n=1 Tax=Ameca splendens TaxID=208324 RepID=A0ABV0YY28_9TELE
MERRSKLHEETPQAGILSQEGPSFCKATVLLTVLLYIQKKYKIFQIGKTNKQKKQQHCIHDLVCVAFTATNSSNQSFVCSHVLGIRGLSGSGGVIYLLLTLLHH